MAQGYLAQVQALIDERMKENPEEMKRKLKEIEEAKKKVKEAPKSPPKPSIDPQLTQELIEELHKDWASDTDIQKIKDLIKRGADIKKAKDEADFTVLHIASYFGDVELAKECLQAGIDVNSKDYYCYSPLHYAVREDNLDLAKILISAGADVNAKTKWSGKMPLHVTDSVEVAKLLISAGADVNAKDKDGVSPLYRAISRGNKEMQALLKRHGATY